MRPKWPLPSDDELRTHIEEYHSGSIDERLERYRFIWQEFGPPADMLLVGGIPAVLALQELRLCFIEGYYLACVLLVQIFVEHSLGGSYIMSGDDRIAERGFAQLIDNALADNHTSPDIASRLHELRRIRNAYVHPKAGLGPRTYMKRLIDEQGSSPDDLTPEDLARQDAESAIQILVDFLREGSRRSGHLWEPPPE